MSSVKKEFGILGSSLLVLALLSAVVLPVPAQAQLDYPFNPTDSEVANALDYLRAEQTADGDIGGFSTSAWVTMAIAAAGEYPHDWQVGSNPSIVDYLRTETSPAKLASEMNPTNAYARTILAIVAADENPTDFGGVDYVAGIKTYYDGNQMGSSDLVNDDFWGVVALISAGESLNSEIIQNSVAFIKSCQQLDGGWGFDAEASWGTDVDSVAAAIMALIAAGEEPTSPAVTNGLAYIKSKQRNNGGFLSWGATNADTDSWAIDAIVATGQDPTSGNWAKNGNTPVDDLLSFQQGDGSFYWQSGTPGMSVPKTTASAIQALLAKPYPVKVLEPEEGVSVYVRVEGQSSTIWRGNVSVSESDITADNSDTTYHLSDPTVLGALDEASNYEERFPYCVTDEYGGLHVKSINGEGPSGMNGWIYRVDYRLPNVGAGDFILNETTPPAPPHEEVLFYYGAWDAAPLKISVNKTEVEVGEEFAVTVTEYSDDTHEWSPCEGATIYLAYEEAVVYVYAEKDGYVRSDKMEVKVMQSWDPWIYDQDGSGYIEIGELLHAIGDYIGGDIDIGQLLNLIDLYLEHSSKP